MDKHTLFESWAPTGGRWSPWAKAAPFTLAAEVPTPLPRPPLPAPPWLAATSDRPAIIVDCAGPDSVDIGLALARAGFRPVPLFNSLPAPRSCVIDGVPSRVDAHAILAALIATAPELSARAIPVDAPPAFLLDSRRGETGGITRYPYFDNRSVALASDFPSATLLREHGIHRAVLVHDDALPVGRDLAHALAPWRQAGLPITTLTSTGQPLDVEWPTSGIFGRIGQRLYALFGLEQHIGGNFGNYRSGGG